MQGSLAQLDSQNPVLYVDFPQGRLKFFGTIVFPKTNYMLLKFGQKEVLCEDIFENMVSFCHDWLWHVEAWLQIKIDCDVDTQICPIASCRLCFLKRIGLAPKKTTLQKSSYPCRLSFAMPSSIKNTALQQMPVNQVRIQVHLQHQGTIKRVSACFRWYAVPCNISFV